MRMHEHHPYRIECDVEEVIREEDRRGRDTREEGYGSVDAFAAAFEVLEASRS